MGRARAQRNLSRDKSVVLCATVNCSGRHRHFPAPRTIPVLDVSLGKSVDGGTRMPIATAEPEVKAPTKQEIEDLKQEIRDLLPHYQTRRLELGCALIKLQDMLA